MVSFHRICPKLAKEECRSIHLTAAAKTRGLPADEFALMESYCTDKSCDCRRVILTVTSRDTVEATISFGFDPSGDMPGPFLDPLNKQGAHATEILSLVKELVLADPQYVARLERHYTITKDIIAGRLRPQDAPPSPRLNGLIPAPVPSPAPPMCEANRVVEPELIGNAFDIHQPVLDADGEYDEDLAEEYREELGNRFAESPEAQRLLEGGSNLGWAETMVHYGIDYLSETPPEMSARDVAEVVFEIFPRKVSMEAEQAEEVIAELHAFWRFLQREYQLENAAGILELLGPGAEERLHDELDDPANFGMAKSFFMAGKKAGFDMTSKHGLTAFTAIYNATSGLDNACSRMASPVQRGMSNFDDEAMHTEFGNRSDRRAAERANLRDAKKRQRQAKRRNRR